MSTLNAAFFAEVKERATAKCLDLSLEMIDAMLGVGDEPLDRAQRIARFLDDAQSGALDALKVVKPSLYQQLVTQFREDMAASPLMQPADEESA